MWVMLTSGPLEVTAVTGTPHTTHPSHPGYRWAGHLILGKACCCTVVP
jgi:hypothetical protein